MHDFRTDPNSSLNSSLLRSLWRGRRRSRLALGGLRGAVDPLELGWDDDEVALRRQELRVADYRLDAASGAAVCRRLAGKRAVKVYNVELAPVPFPLTEPDSL